MGEQITPNEQMWGARRGRQSAGKQAKLGVIAFTHGGRMMPNKNGKLNEESLPLVAFDLDAVSRITGLSLSRIRRWDRMGFYQPAYADPNRRRPGSRIYSEDDVIALKVIAELRERGASLDEIKRTLPRLAPDDDGDWPALTLHVVGRRVVTCREDEAELKEAPRQGDGVKPIDLAATVADVEDGIRRLSERLPEEVGRITRRRAIMQGAPVIAGTRIPTETIAWFHENGYSLNEILENFPRLTPKDVEAAIAFEGRRKKDVPEPAFAHALG